MEIFKIIIISILILETILITFIGIKTIIKIDKTIKEDEEEIKKIREKLHNL